MICIFIYTCTFLFFPSPCPVQADPPVQPQPELCHLHRCHHPLPRHDTAGHPVHGSDGRLSSVQPEPVVHCHRVLPVLRDHPREDVQSLLHLLQPLASQEGVLHAEGGEGRGGEGRGGKGRGGKCLMGLSTSS